MRVYVISFDGIIIPNLAWLGKIWYYNLFETDADSLPLIQTKEEGKEEGGRGFMLFYTAVS